MEKEIQLYINNEKKRIEYNADKYASVIKIAKIWKMRANLKEKRNNNNSNNNSIGGDEYQYNNNHGSRNEYVNSRKSPILNSEYIYSYNNNNNNNHFCPSDHPFDSYPTTISHFAVPKLTKPSRVNINNNRLPKLPRNYNVDINNEVEENDCETMKYDRIDEDDRKALLLSWKEKIDEYNRIIAEVNELNNKCLTNKERIRFERLIKKKRDYERWVKKKKQIIDHLYRDISCER